MTGTRLDKDTAHNLSPEGWPLLARYDLETMKREVDRDAIAARPAHEEAGFWKWRELLPVARNEDVVSLGEVDTPLIETPKVAAALGSPPRSGSRMRAACPPAASRRAVWRWRCPWRNRLA